jgi:hypothetical protein
MTRHALANRGTNLLFALLLAGGLLAASAATARADWIPWRPTYAVGIACPTDGRPGVYLYDAINYTGRCSYFVSFRGALDAPVAADWTIGNDTASSLRIVNGACAWNDVYLQTAFYHSGQEYRFIGQNIPDFRAYAGLNDTISSLQILNYAPC